MNDVNGYKEDHGHTNWRIFWALLFNTLALSALLHEYLHGFKQAKLALLIASTLFLASTNAYHLWQRYLSIQTFYRGSVTVKSGQMTVWLVSKMKLPEGEYEIQVMHPSAGKQCKIVNTYKTCIGKVVTEDGFIDVAALVADLQSLRLHQS